MKKAVRQLILGTGVLALGCVYAVAAFAAPVDYDGHTLVHKSPEPGSVDFSLIHEADGVNVPTGAVKYRIGESQIISFSVDGGGAGASIVIDAQQSFAVSAGGSAVGTLYLNATLDGGGNVIDGSSATLTVGAALTPGAVGSWWRDDEMTGLVDPNFLVGGDIDFVLDIGGTKFADTFFFESKVWGGPFNGVHQEVDALTVWLWGTAKNATSSSIGTIGSGEYIGVDFVFHGDEGTNIEIPEPMSLTLLGAGLVVLGAYGRRRRA